MPAISNRKLQSMSAGISASLKQQASALGFSMVGIVPAQPARRLSAYLNWIEQAYHGEMGYLARPDRVARRRDLNLILPDVQTIISVGLDYGSMELPAKITQDPSRGRISNYAWGVDYHDFMTPRLEQLGAWLREQLGETVRQKVYVDTGAILERDHAENAGLGFTGKNSMLIAPRRGSWFFLGELLTTAILPPDMPAYMPSCGHCTRCLTACPTSAFPAPYILDARRCISYLTIELKGWIPHDLRPLMGNWLYGCDVCQVVCPFNRFAPTMKEPTFLPANDDHIAPPLLQILALDEARFAQRFANSPIKRIKRERLVRNACVNAGNWGDSAAVPVLSQLLDDDSLIVRGHSAWALGQIGTEDAVIALQKRLAIESDELVLQEIQFALQTKK